MELLTVKLVVLTLSTIVRVFFGLFPLFLVKTLSRKWTALTDSRLKKVISFLMFFGGGVLLATSFLHMMPHVRMSFEEAAPNLSFPIAEVIFIVGFFLVYMLEDVVHSLVHKRRSRKKLKQSNLSKSHSTGTLTTKVSTESIANNNQVTPEGTVVHSSPMRQQVYPPIQNGNNVPIRETREIFHKNGNGDGIPGVMNQSKNVDQRESTGDKFAYTDPDWWRDTVLANSQINILSASHLAMHDVPLTIQPDFQKSNGHGHGQLHDHHQHHHHDSEDSSSDGHSHMPFPIPEDDADASIGAEIRNLLICVAISFHGIFEGMAIGLQGTEKDVWYLFLAVSLHECTIIFCIGVELLSSKTKAFRMVIYILVVSLVCPVGIAIGIILTEKQLGLSTMTHTIIVGSFQGLASGTLLYVTFFEIFQEEGRKLHRKYIHILVAVLGFALMACMELVGGHSHKGGGDHGHSHDHGHGHGHSHTVQNSTEDYNHSEEDDHHDHGHGHSHSH